LKRIQELIKRYSGFIIGYSDHTYPDKHMVIPSLAVAMGAKVIEKHYTLDKTAVGSGQFFSSDAIDFKNMIENIRLCEEVMGKGSIEVNESEQGAVKGSRKSVIVNCTKISEGTILTKDMLIGKRPGTGIPIDQIDSVIGLKTKKELFYDEIISWDDLQKNEAL
jgi:N-acetylneuraminate synthase